VANEESVVFEQQLRVPGPTPLPERVTRAAARPMINHRGPEFVELLAEITAGMQSVLRTRNDVLLFPASGSGGLEAAVVNMVSPGERALFCSMGSFGQRWIDMATGCGVGIVTLAAPPGHSISAADVDQALVENPDVTTVFVTHNETSTGVTNDIPAIAAVVKRHGKLLCVDSVSGAPCLPLDVDKLEIDVVVCGSQKGWMAPPGLTMIGVSPAALDKSRDARLPRWYFDFIREKKMQDQSQTATTPPVSVLFAIEEGLRIIQEEGVENGWERHRRIGKMIRAGVEAMGLSLLAQAPYYSDTVTAILSPAESPDDLKAFMGLLRTRYGVVLAGGQGDLRGKIFRIGHLGYIGDGDVYVILEAIEKALLDTGVVHELGRAVPAASASRAVKSEPQLAAV
jgi:aspartate aminotransferase-like enzyme